MLCDFCHEREAVLFVEQVGPTEKKKMNICMDCAISRGISPDTKSIEKSIGGLFDELSKSKKVQDEKNDRACPVCGKRLSEVRRTGLLGCPECYAVYKDDVVNYLKKNGITGSYTGSMPRRLASFRSVLTDRVDIQAKLDLAIKDENYEKAAFYRDYLHALENSSVASEGSAIDE